MAFGLIFFSLTAGVGAAGQNYAAPQAMTQADVVLLGEIHDNPAHHEAQAELVAALQPKAVIWEMLTPQQAERLAGGLPEDEDALRRLLNWDQTGWPDFSLYAPIFMAAPDALHIGAQVPRSDARAVMSSGAAKFFGPEAADYGLDQPLGADELAQRQADQLRAHCDALPEAMLPLMVDFQRLRDATLARAALQAFDRTGGPVVVVTGNGHARRDRGVPVYLSQRRPDLILFALGQSEDGAISGEFDAIWDAPAVERPDPCLAFAPKS
jgi:uncharacterized iron-regulated protein